MTFFTVYQFVGPIVLFTLAYSLWLRRFAGDHRLVWLVMSVPIAFGYVIPAIGANMLRLWELKTRFRMGRIRPHNGFVFGSAASLIAWLCLGTTSVEPGLFPIFRGAFVLCSVLAFWNWLYEAHAIRAGFIVIYNRLWAENAGPDAIAAGHAPVLFGTFGACYGASIVVALDVVAARAPSSSIALVLAASLAAALVLPPLTYIGLTWLWHGETGLRSYAEDGAARERAGSGSIPIDVAEALHPKAAAQRTGELEPAPGDGA